MTLRQVALGEFVVIHWLESFLNMLELSSARYKRVFTWTCSSDLGWVCEIWACVRGNDLQESSGSRVSWGCSEYGKMTSVIRIATDLFCQCFSYFTNLAIAQIEHAGHFVFLIFRSLFHFLVSSSSTRPHCAVPFPRTTPTRLTSRRNAKAGARLKRQPQLKSNSRGGCKGRGWDASLV